LAAFREIRAVLHIGHILRGRSKLPENDQGVLEAAQLYQTTRQARIT
jgi:hypothetical protein